MTTTTVKQPTSKPEVIKPVKNDAALDLDKVLAQVWNQGMPNSILNTI